MNHINKTELDTHPRLLAEYLGINIYRSAFTYATRDIPYNTASFIVERGKEFPQKDKDKIINFIEESNYILWTEDNELSLSIHFISFTSTITSSIFKGGGNTYKTAYNYSECISEIKKCLQDKFVYDILHEDIIIRDLNNMETLLKIYTISNMGIAIDSITEVIEIIRILNSSNVEYSYQLIDNHVEIKIKSIMNKEIKNENSTEDGYYTSGNSMKIDTLGSNKITPNINSEYIKHLTYCKIAEIIPVIDYVDNKGFYSNLPILQSLIDLLHILP